MYILDFVDGLGGIGNLVVDDGVHFAGDVVLGDRVLLGDVDGFGSDIDSAERLEDGDDEFPAGPNDVAELTHGIHNAALIFVDLLKTHKNEDKNKW